jgi:hypothetical protein
MVDIINGSLAYASAEESVDFFKKPKVYLAIGRPPNQFILFRVELAKQLKKLGV